MYNKITLPVFGKYLRDLRLKTKSGSQRKVAKKVGISQSLITNYETGKVDDPDERVLRALAKVYKIPFLDLLLELVKEKYTLNEDEWRKLTILRGFERACAEAQKIEKEAGHLRKVLHALTNPH